MKKLTRLLSIMLCLCLVCPAVNTFAASSTASGVTITSDNDRTLPSGENLLLGQLPIYVEYTPPNQTYIQKENLPENTNMTDGKPATDWFISKMVFAEYKNDSPVYYRNGEANCCITYFLDNVTDITKICLINHSTVSLRTSKYEIYVAKDLKTLYGAESRIAYVENLDAKDRQIINCNNVQIAQDAIFVGIKILSPVQESAATDFEVSATLNNHYPRICEFAIYGNEGELAEYPAVTNTSNKTVVSTTPPITDELNLKDSSINFLEGATLTAYKYSSNASGEEKMDEGNTTTQYLTDGDITTSDYHITTVKFATRDDNGLVTVHGSDTHYVDVRLDAGSPQELGALYIRHHNTKELRTMHYKIFASSSSDKPSNSDLIAECFNGDATQDQYFMVSKGQSITARYYTIRVYDPCFDYNSKHLQNKGNDGYITNSYPRLLEVAAFTPEAISAKLKLEDFQKVDGTNYGYIKPGTEVKSIINSFVGRGSVRVENAQGKIKAPSEVLQCGDKVIAEADYGTDVSASFKFRGDLNGDNSMDVSDVQRICDSIINRNTDLTLGDVNDDNIVTVTDVVCLSGIIVGKHKGVQDTTPAPAFGTKTGITTNGRYEVTVDTNTIINDDFRGFGTNSFTSILTAEGMNKLKYNKVYHELTAERNAAMKPAISRVWFQVDWITTKTVDDYTKYKNDPFNDLDYINYKDGKYDFENKTMQAFYDYVEMLASTGCKIELNFGWKTATRIQYWFNAPCNDFRTGAPKDLEAFGKAAATLIKYLNEEKGYDFIEAIAFYNEPSSSGDFEITNTDEKYYWSQLVHKADAAMKEMGVDKLVEIWGPEVAEIGGPYQEKHREWFQYQLDNTASCIDQWTGHNYYDLDGVVNNYSRTFDTLVYFAEKTNKNMMITEMYPSVINESYTNWYSWNDSFTGYYIAASNTGTDGLLNWSLVGGYIPDPMYLEINGKRSGAWRIPNSEENASGVNRVFYENSIFTNYIPDGSKVLHTGWIGSDIRAASYLLPGGYITVVVENNGVNKGAVLSKGKGAAKNITINFSDGKDRTFKRISYCPETQSVNANATVNRPDQEIEAENGVLTDNYGEQYSVHLYTTAPIVKQIEMENVILHTSKNSSVSVKGRMLDCDADDKIIYTISEFTGSAAGTVSAAGIYTPADSAKSGDMVAVRASLESDPTVFGVSIIYIN